MRIHFFAAVVASLCIQTCFVVAKPNGDVRSQNHSFSSEGGKGFEEKSFGSEQGATITTYTTTTTTSSSSSHGNDSEGTATIVTSEGSSNVGSSGGSSSISGGSHGDSDSGSGHSLGGSGHSLGGSAHSHGGSRKGKGDSREGKGDSREGKGDSREGKGDSREGKGDSREGKGDSREGKGDSREGKGDGREGKGDGREGKGDNREGKGDSREGKGDSREGKDRSGEGKVKFVHDSGDGDSTIVNGEESWDSFYDFDFNLDDEDFKKLNVEKVTTVKSKTVHNTKAVDCEKALKERDDDNDMLTRQLITANKEVTSMSGENTAILLQLGECRDINSGLVTQIETVTYESFTIKKKASKLSEEYGKLQTNYNTVRTEIQSWKSKYDVSGASLKQCQDNNFKLEFNLKETRVRITTLETTIKEVNVANANVGAESNEWKRKYEIEEAQRVAFERKIRDLEESNANLKEKNLKLTEELSSTRDNNQKIIFEKIELEKLRDQLRTDLSSIRTQNTNCQHALDDKVKELKQEDVDDLQEAIIRDKLKVDLEECKRRFTVIENNYESEKTNVVNCRNEISVIRSSCTASNKKYQDEIESVRIRFQAEVDECEGSLKSEINKSSESIAEINRLQVTINSLNFQLNVSIQELGEFKTRQSQCLGDVNTYKQTIENLKISISETNTQLTASGQYSASLQNELSECRSSQDNYSVKLKEIEVKFSNSETTIVQLNIQINELEGKLKQSEANVVELRCEVSKFLQIIKASEEKAYNLALEIVGNYDGSKKNIDTFVNSHNISCTDSKCDN